MTHTFVLERTDRFLDVLRDMVTRGSVRITNVRYHEGRSEEGAYEPFPEDGYWGRNDTWYRFKASAAIPASLDGKYVRCRVITGREALWNALNPQFLVRVDGKVVQALDTNHHDFPLSFKARAGQTYDLDFEAYAGREYDNRTFRELPARFDLSIYWHDKAAEDLYYDLYAACKAAEIFDETDYRRIQIEGYLTKALNLLDFRVPGSEDYERSVRQAQAFMKDEFYGKFCGSDEVIANCIGHTHIDVAWMWRFEQTRAKACRSFSTELSLMKEYPELRFMSSQPQLYQFVKEDCPEVYEGIKEQVKEGRWEPEGAMWLEADCNLTSGESLIRQILHGKHFLKQEFGVDSHILWEPDVFGYSAALPQIMKKSGIDTFVTSKISWSETNHFPHDTFLWKGIDGTEIFTQFILVGNREGRLGDGNYNSTYNGAVMPISQAKGWEIYQEKALNHELLCTVGCGDGGGGVTREMLEMNRRMQYGIPGIPKTRFTTAGDTIARIKKNVEGKKLPKWYGELYLERHRGTYTSIGKNKRYNRVCEFLLQEVESLGLMDKMFCARPYPKEELYKDWTTVLLHQFHDVIPGSSIKEVYEDTTKAYEELIARNEQKRAMQLSDLAASCAGKGLFVYNRAGVKRDGLIETDGREILVKDVPALGWKVVDPAAEQAEGAEKPMLSADQHHLENQYYQITLDETGCLTSLYDKMSDREILAGRGGVLEAFDDHPRDYDDWEICSYYQEKKWEIDDVQSIRVQVGEEKASVHISRKFERSTLEETITVYRNLPGVDFHLDVDWHEHHVFLKTAFPVDIISDKATYEIQYGAIERPAHMNTSWDEAKFEVCAHKWADFGEAGYGVALMNDCKYGYAIHDGVMRLSLIKCGTNPNPEADQGHHTISYCLVPHKGDWRSANIPALALAYNCPLETAVSEGSGTLDASYSLVSSSEPNVIVTTVKESCDGQDIIIRAYEAQGIRTKASFTLGFDPKGVCETDMMEEKVFSKIQADGHGFTSSFGPYEIKTFRVNTTRAGSMPTGKPFL